MNSKVIGFVFLTGLIATSCIGDDYTCDLQSHIKETGLPDSVNQGQKITFPVQHFIYGCDGFYCRNATTIENKIVTITFYAERSGRACDFNHWPTMTTPYDFTANPTLSS